MKMFNIINKSSIRLNNIVEGETIENKVKRMVENNEPIKDGAPLIFMERNKGLNADCDPRTDRFDVAILASDVVTKSKIAQRLGDRESGKVVKDATDGNDAA